LLHLLRGVVRAELAGSLRYGALEFATRGGLTIGLFDIEIPKDKGARLDAADESVAEIDRLRFPDATTLTAELENAGFSAVRIETLTQPGALSRPEALERIRGRYISTLNLIARTRPRIEHRQHLVTESHALVASLTGAGFAAFAAAM
jgi:hypothetical protein